MPTGSKRYFPDYITQPQTIFDYQICQVEFANFD